MARGSGSRGSPSCPAARAPAWTATVCRVNLTSADRRRCSDDVMVGPALGPRRRSWAWPPPAGDPDRSPLLQSDYRSTLPVPESGARTGQPAGYGVHNDVWRGGDTVTQIGREHRVPVIRAPHRLVGVDAQVFHDQLDAAIEAGQGVVVIDMADLVYISNAGLRVIMQAARKTRGRNAGLVFCSLSDDVRSVFRTSGLDRLVDIRPSREDATRAVGGMSRTHATGPA